MVALATSTNKPTTCRQCHEPLAQALVATSVGHWLSLHPQKIAWCHNLAPKLRTRGWVCDTNPSSTYFLASNPKIIPMLPSIIQPKQTLCRKYLLCSQIKNSVHAVEPCIPLHGLSWKIFNFDCGKQCKQIYCVCYFRQPRICATLDSSKLKVKTLVTFYNLDILF